MNFLTETLTVVVGIIVADTLMDKQRRDDATASLRAAPNAVSKAARYLRGEATIMAAQLRAKAAR